jgi:hypothetical protein
VVAGAVAGAAELEVASALEDAVEESLGQVGIMEREPPGGKGLVGGKDHGLAGEVALIDDLEEHVGGVVAKGEIAHLVDDEHMGMKVVVECFGEATGASGVGELLDELHGRGEASLEAVLDGSVGDADGESSLPGSGGSGQDEVASFGDEFRSEEGAEEPETDGGLEGEVEVLDGAEEGEAGLAHGALDAGLGSMGDLLCHQEGEIVAVAHLLGLGLLLEFGIQAPDGGKVQALEHGVEVHAGEVGGRGHALTFLVARSVTYSAPTSPRRRAS